MSQAKLAYNTEASLRTAGAFKTPDAHLQVKPMHLLPEHCCSQQQGALQPLCTTQSLALHRLETCTVLLFPLGSLVSASCQVVHIRESVDVICRYPLQ